MVDYPFALRLNSPAFAGSVPRGKKTVQVLDRGVPKSLSVAYHPVDAAGLRIPALRGVLEMWFRTLLGHLPPGRLFAAQEAVFGSADGGQGLRLRPEARPGFRAGELRFERNFYPLLYLGYGPLQLWKDPVTEQNRLRSYNKHACRDAILLDGDPVFRFLARGDESRIEALERALVLLHLFGGLGGRSRRGWGSVAVEAPCIEPMDPGESPGSWVERHLVRAFAGLPGMSAELRAEPRFSAFSQGSEIRVLPVVQGDYRGVLGQLFERMRQVRFYNKTAPTRSSKTALTDHALEVADAQAGALSDVPLRLAFGMPYFPQSSQRDRGQPVWRVEYLHWQAGSAAHGQPGSATGRRASPLFLKVHRHPGGGRFGVALFLDAAFFGTVGDRIAARGLTGDRPPPPYTAVRDFLAEPAWIAVDPNHCARLAQGAQAP